MIKNPWYMPAFSIFHLVGYVFFIITNFFGIEFNIFYDTGSLIISLFLVLFFVICGAMPVAAVVLGVMGYKKCKGYKHKKLVIWYTVIESICCLSYNLVFALVFLSLGNRDIAMLDPRIFSGIFFFPFTNMTLFVLVIVFGCIFVSRCNKVERHIA